MRLLKSLVQAALRRAGYYVAPLPGRRGALPDPLIAKRFDLLLDVGGNVGQYAAAARNRGYAGRIVSFEPLPDAHAQLTAAAAGDPLWTVHDRCAVGEAEGVVTINVSRNSYSSSLLPAVDRLTAHAPDAAYVDTAETPVIRLDSVFDRYARAGDRVFLKIDTQGFEGPVLRGLGERLRDVCGVQIELSIRPLYEGQELWLALLNVLDAAGFDLWEIEPGFGQGDGQRLQFDAVMIRRD